MKGENLRITEEYLQEHRLEIETRIKNLFWTVCGDYSLEIRPNLHTFARSKYLALYDAVKQGAFSKYFGEEELGSYLMKKIYSTEKEKSLFSLTQLCVDAAVFPYLQAERSGIKAIRTQAFEDCLAERQKDENDVTERIRRIYMERALKREVGKWDGNILWAVQKIESLERAVGTEELLTVIDEIFNRLYGGEAERTRRSLQQTLKIPAAALPKAAWEDCYTDEQMAEIVKKFLANQGKSLLQLEMDTSRKKWYGESLVADSNNRVFLSERRDSEKGRKIYDYIELNCGKSFLTLLETQKMEQRLCRGIHRGCHIHYTDGILRSGVKKNNQYRLSQLQFEKNRRYYGNHHWIVKRNISVLSETLRKVLVTRQEDNYYRSRTGKIVPRELWKAELVQEEKLFWKKEKRDSSDFVIDILLDCSGSQSKRQPQVATEGYIISEALSAVGIPHRVISYCTFWEYTILNRFRDYDDRKEQNLRIFEYRASANNRDGLAIKAVCDSMLQRTEEHKILIVLSDGCPYDGGRVFSGVYSVQPYIGKEAIKDTAFEIRRMRGAGICVMGIFAGAEEDLTAEKKMYEKDFAYIRNISSFSHIVGKYLCRQIDEERL